MTDNDTGRQERAALYALGALGDEERKAFEQDLAGSPSLRRDVESFRGIADELAQAGRRTSPPASLKDRLLARVAREPQEEKTPGILLSSGQTRSNGKTSVPAFQ
jgi:anti-sigma-K factor RskA